MLPLLCAASLLSQVGPPAQVAARPSIEEKLISAAEGFLGAPYVFGGRDGRSGCRGVPQCESGIDCLSLIFFSFEKVFGTPWTRFSVMPSISVQRKELGTPVPGLDGVLLSEADTSKLRKADVLFFLLEDYNLEADRPLLVREGRSYGVWHTGLVHSQSGEEVNIIHAKPGDRVVIEPLSAISMDGLYALRLPQPRARR